MKYENLFFAVKHEEMICDAVLQTGQVRKNVAQKCLWSELVQCSIFCPEKIDDLIMARTGRQGTKMK